AGEKLESELLSLAKVIDNQRFTYCYSKGKLSQNMTDYILLIRFNRLLFHQNNERRIFQWLNGKQP
ncbi:hypothetical protein, partial [Enterococcus faecalis]|uniref:hypothetical protein n=1 Tax=Enterococcus faecalis TaxID=1351 RepID=UPI0029550B7C